MSSEQLTFFEPIKGMKIAYEKMAGQVDVMSDIGYPGIVFCSGFMSSMEGTKAVALHNFCKKRNLSYVRFDYSGTYKSAIDGQECLISSWKENIKQVVLQLTKGPQILVGSSMGGWLMLLVAMEIPERIHSLVGIATAADFIERRFGNLTEREAKHIQENGLTVSGQWGDWKMSPHFVDDAKQFQILNKDVLNITCPIRLIHGMKDDTVPYETSLSVASKVTSQDVDILFRKDGEHRMSMDSDIELLLETVSKLLPTKNQSKM
ncbi:unnamed protein product [Owenia fusiformis]|uniref:Peptidase S9 prolyl oligopeptidase catalytic domain-containing protein n=1 Tax=Owenia fusiformis TaxID=6347 RepID=A0A8S4PS90_OWEFU|nr:unnamed protein product [Owenia fusiformis]